MLWTMNLRKPISNKKKERTVEIDHDKIDLSYKTVCLSGTVPKRARSQVMAILRLNYEGVLFSISVTKNVDFLVVGYGVGQTKLAKAKKYNIPIIEWSKVL